MLDNLKLITYDQTIIQRLAKLPGFVSYHPRNNNYAGFCKYGKRMRLDFRKSFESGVFAGFHHLEISLSPHYHYNNYLHNGNDFTPENCIKTLSDMLQYVTIKPDELDALKVVNMEFGLNIIPETDIKNLINNILYFKKTAFVLPQPENPYFKITDATKFKNIKAYAKGLQFAKFPQYGIDPNTFRFEVKSKKSANIERYGIDKVSDLFKIEVYQRLGQELLNEWENILLITQTLDFSNLKTDEVQFISNANKPEFWDDLKRGKHRNTFQLNKGKYYKILTGKNNLHTVIKGQIIDKLIKFSKCAYFPQPTPVNIEKDQNAKDHPKEINGQFAHFNKCLITGLDISTQKKGSKFLRETTLKNIKENDPDTYQKLELKYLTEKAKTLPEKRQIYLICKNIRDTDSNPRNNRQRFEQRNYHPDQLQLTF